jgi:CubicO group peptidase (beta-lactamase class C family)
MTHYSNVGPSLAALIVEYVTNMSFEQYVQDKILKRLDIDKNEAAYRISNFESRKKVLVEHFIYNSSWLEIFQNLVPQLNSIQVNY